jgi:mono/diheme cytochrome c family protein
VYKYLKSLQLKSAWLVAVLMAVSAIFNFAKAQPNGEQLFKANCAQCHNPVKDLTGPALKGVSGRVPSKEWLYKWVHNSAAVIASGDKYANEIYAKYNKTAMTGFPNLSTEEIDAIVKYVEDYTPPVAAGKGGAGEGAHAAGGGDNTTLYVILTMVLVLVAGVLVGVNRHLKKMANAKDGVPVLKDVPFYKNKVYIALIVVLAFIGMGYWLGNMGMNVGRQKDYMPEQPIFYSHKVHAGVNQVNCLYCHAGAEKSRQAMIPSSNVCMNCHKAIDEYTGEQLYNAEGKKIDGTAEIKKLYKFAGWDPAKKDYIRDAAGNIQATPIEWVKIHNLPDHVYFNHSQHVKVGKVQCQQCHGSIEEMDEVYQFSDLSMGWCVNCHRTTKVQFADNNYYSIYQKYHDEIKAGKRDSVTVKDIGGLECQKCHY